VLILRWFWWRINAAAELAAMVGGFGVGLTTSVVPLLTIADFGLRLLTTTAITMVIWVTAMVLTPPESDETLDRFYRKVLPGGPGWARQRQRTGLWPAQSLRHDLLKALAALLLLLGAMLGVGGFLLFQPLTGWFWLIIAVLGWVWLRQLGKTVNSQPGPDDAPGS
jgi:solute:Na+ symporter, SSS family